MFGTSDAWLMSHLSHRPSKPAYYIEDCRISSKDHSYTEAKGKVGFRRFVGKPYIEPLHLNEKCITNQEEDL